MQEHLTQTKQDLEHQELRTGSFDQIIAEQENFAETAQVMSDQSTQVDLLTVKKNQLIQKRTAKVDDEAKIRSLTRVAATAKGRLDDISKTI